MQGGGTYGWDSTVSIATCVYTCRYDYRFDMVTVAQFRQSRKHLNAEFSSRIIARHRGGHALVIASFKTHIKALKL